MSDTPRITEAPISPHERRECQRCGAYCANSDTSCWFCKRDFSLPVAPPLRPGQFSLAALVGAMTAIAVWLGIFLFSPALAIVIVLFSGAALVRLAVVEELQVVSGTRHVPAHFAWRFFVSLMLTLLAAVVAAAAFVLGCFASALMATDSGPPMPDFPLWPIGLGFVFSLIFAGLFLWGTRHVTFSE